MVFNWGGGREGSEEGRGRGGGREGRGGTARRSKVGIHHISKVTFHTMSLPHFLALPKGFLQLQLMQHPCH